VRNCGGSASATCTVTDSYGLPDPTPDEVVVTVEDIPIVGLSAQNSSPTMLGEPTYFTATVIAGSNVVYEWAFGNGETAFGLVGHCPSMMIASPAKQGEAVFFGLTQPATAVEKGFQLCYNWPSEATLRRFP